jgi:hypothetical protein
LLFVVASTTVMKWVIPQKRLSYAAPEAQMGTRTRQPHNASFADLLKQAPQVVIHTVASRPTPAGCLGSNIQSLSVFYISAAYSSSIAGRFRSTQELRRTAHAHGKTLKLRNRTVQ